MTGLPFYPHAKLGDVIIEASGPVIKWTSGLQLDLDGSPRAYHPADWGPRSEWTPIGRARYGLDAPENGGVATKVAPGNWKVTESWGWATKNGLATGEPIIQGPNDLHPGFYVSTTSLIDSSYPASNPKRYVNAEEVPFIVWPSHLSLFGEIPLGDIALVCYQNKRAFAIVADIGPANKIGEGSLALHKALREDPEHAHISGIDSGVTFYVFIGSGSKTPLTCEEIEKRGNEYFQLCMGGAL